jgi:hypothetical protein
LGPRSRAASSPSRRRCVTIRLRSSSAMGLNNCHEAAANAGRLVKISAIKHIEETPPVRPPGQ